MTKKSIQNRSIAESLFTSRARLAVLKLLLLNADRSFYLREIAARTGQAVRAVQIEVARLEGSGLLTSEADGSRKYYRANIQAPVYPELKALLLKTVGLGDVLRDHLRHAPAEIAVAFLYGSFARGTDTASSDVDILVVGSISGRSLSRLLAPARESLAREINPVLFTETELRDRVTHSDHFLLTILGEPKIFLIGGEHDLERIAGPRKTSAAQDKPQGS